MSTQRQRARNAAAVAAAREAESTARAITEPVAPDEVMRELPRTGRYPTAELLAQSIAESLDTPVTPLSAPDARADMNDRLRALIDGSAIALQPVVATSDRFAGKPPAVPGMPLRPSIGSFRFRSKSPK
jgi:hypothetical protein